MAMIPIAVFHFLFAAIVISSLVLMWLFRYFFSATFLPSALFLVVVLAALLKVVSTVFANTMMFAGHGFPFFGLEALGPSSPHGDFACACRHNTNNVVLEHYRDAKFNYNPIYHYYLYKTKDADPTSTTTIFFLHGNGQPACCFSGFAELLHHYHKKANVVLLEYRGYGRRRLTAASFSDLPAMRSDISLAWSHLHSSEGLRGPRVLAGLSLGGGFAWSSLDQLSPAPRQLVLINTFADLGLFLRKETKLYYPAVRRLLPSALTCYDVGLCRGFWAGDVLCVSTKDDDFFGPEHRKAFREHFGERGATWEEFVCPDGGHNGGPAINQGWLKMLKVE